MHDLKNYCSTMFSKPFRNSFAEKLSLFCNIVIPSSAQADSFNDDKPCRVRLGKAKLVTKKP